MLKLVLVLACIAFALFGGPTMANLLSGTPRTGTIAAIVVGAIVGYLVLRGK